MGLSMLEFLQAVHAHGYDAREWLVDLGHHPKVVYSKAIKAARKRYTDYGVVADRPWLTPRGRDYIRDRTTPV